MLVIFLQAITLWMKKRDKNFFTYFGWKMIDMKFKARQLGMKMVFPLRPDPIQQDTMTGKISDHQPVMYRFYP